VLVQFWPHLPESLQEGHINVIPEGGGPTTECPGPGQAAASYMCVYQSFNEGMTFESFISTMPGSIYAGPLSGVMTWRSNQSNGLLRGTWILRSGQTRASIWRRGRDDVALLRLSRPSFLFRPLLMAQCPHLGIARRP